MANWSSKCLTLTLCMFLLTACGGEEVVPSQETEQVVYEVSGLYNMDALSELLPEGASVTGMERQAETLKVTYAVDGEETYSFISPKKIMYDNYGENCGWSEDEIDSVVNTWELNNKIEVDVCGVETYPFGYIINCTGNGINYELICDADKAYSTSRSEISQEVIDSILEEYPNLEEPYIIKSVSDEEIVFVKDGKEFVIKNE